MSRGIASLYESNLRKKSEQNLAVIPHVIDCIITGHHTTHHHKLPDSNDPQFGELNVQRYNLPL